MIKQFDQQKEETLEEKAQRIQREHMIGSRQRLSMDQRLAGIEDSLTRIEILIKRLTDK